MVDYEEIEFCC